MSEAASELDIRAALARIDRDRAETQNFASEQRTLTEEVLKLSAELANLFAETSKLERDHYLSPFVAAGVIAAGVGGVIIALVQVALRLFEG